MVHSYGKALGMLPDYEPYIHRTILALSLPPVYFYKWSTAKVENIFLVFVSQPGFIYRFILLVEVAVEQNCMLFTTVANNNFGVVYIILGAERTKS